MSITKKEFISTSYFLGRAMFLGVGFSYIFRFSKADAWISMIIGYLLGNIIIWLYDKISININYNLNNFLNQRNLVNKFYKLIFFFLYLYLMLYVSIIFTNFIRVYYLYNTPTWATLLLLLSISYYASLKSEHVILRISLILFPISLVMILFDGILLSSFVDLNSFLPLMNNSILNIFKGSIIFAILSAVPSILLLEYNVPLKTKLVSYGISSGIILFINFFITGVLGNILINIYNYPEYMVLRRIKLLDFIENIENFASLIWYFDAFIIISLSLSKIRKMFYSKKKNIYIPLLLLTLIFISYYIFSNYYMATTIFFGSGIIIFGIFIIITCPILYLITKKRKLKN